MTDKHQPLDVGLFGILKAKARSFLTSRIADEVMSNFNAETGEFTGPIVPPKAITKREATVMLEFAWNDITEAQIIDAWEDAIGCYIHNVSFDDNVDFVEIEFQNKYQAMLQKKNKCSNSIRNNKLLIFILSK